MKKIFALAVLGLAFFSFFCSPRALAVEGLWANPADLNASQMAEWGSVFLFVNQSQGDVASQVNAKMGSAFPIRRVDVQGTAKVQFLTAYHVVGDICSRTHCYDSTLYRGFEISGDNPPSRVSGYGLPTLQLREINMVSADPTLDLALLEVDFNLSSATDATNLKNIPFLEILKNCDTKEGDPLVSIGYPDIVSRPHPKVPFDFRNELRERWSKGVWSGGYINRVRNGVTVPVGTTTVDALPSNSGSPVFDASGKVVGMMDAIQTFAARGMPYMEQTGPSGSLPYYSDIIRCQEIKEFLSKNK